MAGSDDRRGGPDSGVELQDTVVDDSHPSGAATDSVNKYVTDKIGRFKVLDLLGAGGMGVVVTAYDPKLDRRVAIKMVRDSIAPIHQVRLEREAKAMAQLSHPNVVTVHEVDLVDGRLFIAMEFVDGETLRDWMLDEHTVEETLRVLVGAGRGLAAAHHRGMVHRDFKPDNVLIGRDGRPRVTDFGLVILPETPVPPPRAQSEPRPSVEPVSLTQTGAVMGTPLYMAPEQHEGLPADQKADQFSFCVVLWEALYGETPFEADGYLELVRKVTAGEMRPRPKDSKVPARIHEVLLRGLEQVPADRYPSMTALLDDLEQKTTGRQRMPVLLAGAALAATVAAGVLWKSRTDDPPPPPVPPAGQLAVVVNDSRRITFDPGCEEMPTISADGRSVIFDGEVDGDYQVQLLDLDSGKRKVLTDMPGWDIYGSLSPDGALFAWVHFGETSRELWIRRVDGAGEPTKVMDRARGVPSWMPWGELVAANSTGQLEIYRIDASGNVTQKRVTKEVGPGMLVYLQSPLPGNRILFGAMPSGARNSDLTIGTVSPKGAIDILMELPADARAGLQSDAEGKGIYYLDTRTQQSGQIRWRDLSGKTEIVAPDLWRVASGMSIAPARDRVVLSTCRQVEAVGIVDGDGSFDSLLQSMDWNETDIYDWTDGEHLLVTSTRSDRSRVWLVDRKGQGEPLLPPLTAEPALSPDKELLVWSSVDETTPGVFIQRVGDPSTRQRVSDHAGDGQPFVSADGQWVFFLRTGEASAQVYRRALEDGVPAASPPVPATPAGVLSFAISPTDDRMAWIAGADRTRVMIGTPGGKFTPIPRLAVGDYSSLSFSRDGAELAVVRGARDLIVLDPADGKTAHVLWSAENDALAGVSPGDANDRWFVDFATYQGDLILLEGRFP